MSVLKLDAAQFGDNADATKNFTLRTNNNGTMTLARGNVGATTQDLLTIGADGAIATPPNLILFSAYQLTSLALAAGVYTKLTCTAEEYDIGSSYDTALSRFQPTKAGYYCFGGGYQAGTVASDLRLAVYKNGVFSKIVGTSVTGSNSNWSYGTAAFYLNGTTDYLELFVWSTAANTTNPTQSSTYIQGHLIAKA